MLQTLMNCLTTASIRTSLESQASLVLAI